MHLTNLDEVVSAIEKLLPEYTFKRGKETCLLGEPVEHANEYEVVQVFQPGENFPIAEFWKGYHSLIPDGFGGIKIIKYSRIIGVHGTLEYVMNDLVTHYRE